MSHNSESANVIPLRQNREQNVGTDMKDELSRLPESVRRIRSLSEKQFKAAIQNMFDHVDDALFELADRTQSNLEQNVFFESMREIRIHRRTMEAMFMEGITDKFAALARPSAPPKPSEPEEDSLEDLSLVSKDELEELVAVDSLAIKASSHNKNDLLILSARLNTMVPAKVIEETVPIAPKVLADSFVEASKQITVDIKAKLVLFKLFERYVMSQLSTVLQHVNNELTELGVAVPKPPKMKPRSQPPSAGATYVEPNQVPYEGQNNTQVPADGLYDTLQSLIQAPAPESNNYSHRPPAADYNVAETPYALLNVLSQLQHQISQVPVVTERVSDEPELISASQITEAISEANGVEEDLDSRSNNVIKLVDMLFSFIMEDKNLPDAIKLLLSRLQIPFIKVALVDEDFFKKDGHAARRLLNEMATASIGWSGDPASGRKDPLYNKINTIVEKVLTEFDSNFEIFSLLLADFVSFVEKERRRVMLFEKRAIDAEGGKAKAQVGRQYVEKQVATLLSGKAIPSIFAQFVRGPWSNILFLTYMKQGINSAQWAEALTVAEDLIWTALPIQNSVHKKKFLQKLPHVNNALHKGLKSIAFNPVKQTKIFDVLKLHHLALLQEFRERSVTKTAAPLPAPNSVDESLNHAEVSHDATPESTDKPISQAAAEVDVNETLGSEAPIVEVPAITNAPEAINDAPEVDVPSHAESNAVEPQADVVDKVSVAEDVVPTVEEVSETVVPVAVEAESADGPETPEPQYINLVDNFVVGVWFERLDKDANFRCRLAAIIRGTGRYIFVNRSGVKVAEETRDSLALQLQRGELRTLDDSMLFDRALESMITNLRKSS